MAILGALLKNWGRSRDAEPWLRQAAEAGDIHAMYDLAVLLAESGRDENAQRWFLRYAENG